MSALEDSQRVDRLRDDIIEAMTGNAVYSETNAHAVLDELLSVHHCASCDGHSCD